MSACSPFIVVCCSRMDNGPVWQRIVRLLPMLWFPLLAQGVGFDYAPGLSNRLYPFPVTPMPAVGIPFRDPAFGTRLVRITDVRKGRFPSRVQGLTNEYSRYDALNADGSLLLVRGTDGSWHLYEMNGYRYRETLFGKRGDFSPRWHTTDPQRLFFIQGSRFYEYHVGKRESRQLYDFKKRYPDASFVRIGKGEGSLDSRYWAFMVIRYDNSKPKGRKRALLDLVTFDAERREIVASLRATSKKMVAKIPRTVTVSMSGSYVLVEYIPRIVVYRRDFSDGRELPGRFGHGDLARGREGQDLFVGQDNDTDQIVMVDLATLERTPIMEIPFRSPRLGGVSYRGFHISGNAADTPGWVLVSTYGNALRPTYWSDGAIFLLELKRDGRHWRIAHTRSMTARTKKKDYWAEAFATIDRRGKNVFWSSNWGVPKENYVDLYRAVLPDGWHRELGAGR